MKARFVRYLLFGVLVLGTGLGIGLGLSEAGSGRPITVSPKQETPSTATAFGSSPTTSTPKVVSVPRPTRTPKAARCRTGQLTAAATSYDRAPTSLVIIFFVANRSTSACAVPAEVHLGLYDNNGDADTSPLPSSGPTPGSKGFFTLRPTYANRAFVITMIENWCEAAQSPTVAGIIVSPVLRLTVPLLPHMIGPGITCINSSTPLEVESPAQVHLFPKEPVTVPRVIGEPRTEVQMTMRIVGLRADFRQMPSTSVPAGLVMAERPNQGAEVNLSSS